MSKDNNTSQIALAMAIKPSIISEKRPTENGMKLELKGVVQDGNLALFQINRKGRISDSYESCSRILPFPISSKIRINSSPLKQRIRSSLRIIEKVFIGLPSMPKFVRASSDKFYSWRLKIRCLFFSSRRPENEFNVCNV